MKLFAPDYYNDFSCIAGKCRHSCCVGWEIDVDDETFEYYKSVSGGLGERLNSGISIDSGTPHFVLSEDERCPFLNKNNLCDIILNIGKDKLCQICADHPRYRNFFSDCTEIGLGLCCEAAGRLILARKQKTRLIVIEDDGVDELVSDEEQVFFALRKRLVDIAQNRTKSINNRIREMLTVCDITLPQKPAAEWADIYLALEHLDFAWTDRLNELKSIKEIPPLDDEWDIPLEQLLVYFLYRHTADGLYDGRFRERVAFAALGVYIVGMLFAAHGDITMNELIEIARVYSSEIE
ncbi:MAG: flagellin lysine-N-methylase, partial [Hominilimicola sp.]